MNSLVILFVIGVAVGIIVRVYHTPRQGAQSMPSKNTKLDMVDNMFLHGEVNGDDFYQ